MHCVGFVDTEDMNMTSRRRKFTSLAAYSNSKLAQVTVLNVLMRFKTHFVICITLISAKGVFGIYNFYDFLKFLVKPFYIYKKKLMPFES